MDRQQILDLYDWEPGLCFRHPDKGEVPTVHVKTVRPAAGGIQDLRACAECILELADKEARSARRPGDDSGV